MDSTGVHNLFRVELNDLDGPFLWSSTEIYSYLDAAQKLFCKLQGGIADSTSSTAQIVVTSGQKFSPFSPRILKILRVSRRSDDRKIDVLNVENVDSSGAVTDDYGAPTGLRLDSVPGLVRAIVTGMEDTQVRLIPVPAADDVLDMTVHRLPLADITGGGQTLEIAEPHHRYLLYGMKQFAYLKEDPETFDRAAADRNEAMFAAYCDQARTERAKREHKPRTVVYGGL